jgi:hypothetical protein
MFLSREALKWPGIVGWFQDRGEPVFSASIAREPGRD